MPRAQRANSTEASEAEQRGVLSGHAEMHGRRRKAPSSLKVSAKRRGRSGVAGGRGAQVGCRAALTGGRQGQGGGTVRPWHPGGSGGALSHRAAPVAHPGRRPRTVEPGSQAPREALGSGAEGALPGAAQARPVIRGASTACRTGRDGETGRFPLGRLTHLEESHRPWQRQALL